MKTITLYPSHIEITPYDEGQATSLLKMLSVWDKNYFRYRMPAYSIYDDTLRIPAGYDIEKVKGYFSNYNIVDKRREFFYPKVENTNLKLNYEPRDDLQLKATNHLKDSIYSFNPYQKYIGIKTGTGKSYVAINYIINSKRIPLIFINKNNLAEQWINYIKEYTNITEEEIYYIKGKDKLKKLLSKSKKDRPYKIYIASYRTIFNFVKDNPMELDNIIQDLGISVKIFDEAHLEFESLIFMDLYINTNSIYLSATPSRSNYLEDRLYHDVFYNVPIFNEKNKTVKEVKKPYHRIIAVNYKSEPSNMFKIDFQEASKSRGFNIALYSEYLVNERFETFSNIIKKLIRSLVMNPDGTAKKTVILMKSIELVDSLRSEFTETDKIKLGTYHSKVSKEDREYAMDSDIIFTTDKSMGTGNDISGLRCIISTIPTSSVTLTEQMLGRLRDIPGKEVVYIDKTY